MRKYKITILLLVMLALIISLCSTAIAAPPAIPTQIPSGGGGGVGSGSYTPPTYQKTTTDLKDSNGTVIGTVVASDYTQAFVTGTVSWPAGNNATYSVTVRDELSSKPENAIMDVFFQYEDGNALPKGMYDIDSLMTLKITRSGSFGWALKDWATQVNLSLPLAALGNASDGRQFYFVRYDGAGYQVLTTTVEASNMSANFSVMLPSDTGVISLVAAFQAKPTPTPTPVPCPTPTPTPLHNETHPYAGSVSGHVTTSAETASGTGSDTPIIGYVMWVAMFLIGLIAGGVIILIAGRMSR